MKNEEYLRIEFDRVKKNLYTKKRSLFVSKEELAKWFVEKLKNQDYKCFYCEISIFEIKELIDNGLLKTRAVRGGGKRGPVLEIDKNDEAYIPENCVLSCYYCNNDKSYTSSKDDYKEYFGKNRGKYFKMLLKQLGIEKTRNKV